jgi:hypothetical protein
VTRAIGSALHLVELVVNCLLGILWRWEFQAFLSWFSRKRLLRDRCKIAGKPIARISSVLRDCGSTPIVGDAAMLC